MYFFRVQIYILFEIKLKYTMCNLTTFKSNEQYMIRLVNIFKLILFVEVH